MYFSIPSPAAEPESNLKTEPYEPISKTFFTKEEKDFINFIYTADSFATIRDDILAIFKKVDTTADINPEFELLMTCLACRTALMKKLRENPSLQIDNEYLSKYLYKSAQNRKRRIFSELGKELKKKISLELLTNEPSCNDYEAKSFFYTTSSELASYRDEINHSVIEDIVKNLKKLARPSDLELLEMKTVDDCSYKEIAEKLGITEGTARKRKFDIIKYLRELMESCLNFTRNDYLALTSMGTPKYARKKQTKIFYI